MRIALIIASGLLVTACEAPESRDAATTDTMSPTMGESAADSMASDMPATAEDYVRRAAISDMYEIEAGKMAIDKATSSETRSFARMMVDDHTASTRDLKAAVGRSDTRFSIPTTLDTEHQAMIDMLDNLEGENFDREYMTQQMSAHRRAMAMHEAYGARGDNEELRTFAQNVVPVIRKHTERLDRDAGTGNNAAATGTGENRMTTGN